LSNYISLLFGLFLISCNSLVVDNTSFSRIEVIGPDEVNIYNHINTYKDSIDYKLDNVIGFSDGL
jgi:hypothetical protein